MGRGASYRTPAARSGARAADLGPAGSRRAHGSARAARPSRLRWQQGPVRGPRVSSWPHARPELAPPRGRLPQKRPRPRSGCPVPPPRRCLPPQCGGAAEIREVRLSRCRVVVLCAPADTRRRPMRCRDGRAGLRSTNLRVFTHLFRSRRHKRDALEIPMYCCMEAAEGRVRSMTRRSAVRDAAAGPDEDRRRPAR